MTPPYFFFIFVITSPLKRTWPLSSTILNPLYLWMICTKSDWNWPPGSEWRKDFSPKVNSCKDGFLHCGSIQPPGTMIFTNLNLQYFRKLFVKSELFWLCGLWEDFQMNPPYFCIFVIISPLNKTWPLIYLNLDSLYLKVICFKFDWNLPAGS
jgi:hypothetical protein